MATSSSLLYTYLLTAAADYLPEAIKEVQRADRAAQLRQHVGEEIAVVASELDMAELYEALHERPPIWLRHIVPVQFHQPLSGAPDDLEQLAQAVLAMAEIATLRPEDRFSVQARVVTPPGAPRPFTPYAIAQALAPAIAEESGATVDVRAPEVVLSLLATGKEVWAGISPVLFNRSDWAGGERRFRREPEQISRAEFKLLEAIELFDLEVPSGGTALDLGAAPGGWVRVLLEQGLHVTAVDPADLDPSIARHERVTRVRGYAQEWIAQATGAGSKYDVVLSDMRMDARDAARLMGEVKPLMHFDSWALLSLKLPTRDAEGMDPLDILHRALDELRSRFRTVQARHLFHNRNEVTVCLRL